MSKRRKRRKRRGRKSDSEQTPPPELTGVARLLSEAPVATLDLHGCTSEQATRRVGDFLATQSRIASGRVVVIVTGKGTGSEGAPVLPGHVRGLLTEDMADSVAELAGAPGGGGWVVRVR